MSTNGRAQFTRSSFNFVQTVVLIARLLLARKIVSSGTGSATDEMYDFEPVSVLQLRLVPLFSRDNLAV